MIQPHTPRTLGRLWKWLARLLLAGLVVLTLLIIFHHPILLGLLHWAGPKGAATLGLPLEWKVDGSLWNSLRITELKTGGGEVHWLPEATLGELLADYDAAALWKQKFTHAVQRVRLHDLEAVVDLRHLPKSDGSPTDENKEDSSGKAPPLVWPKTLDLKNLNVTLTLADGARIIVRGLTLQAGDGMPGVFECLEFRQEPDGLSLSDVKARIEWLPHQIVIRDLALPKGVVLQELALDLREFDLGQVPLHLAAALGTARIEIKASVAGLFTPPLLVDAEIDGQDLRSEELVTLGLPEAVKFDGASVQVKVRGDPLSPPRLDVDARVRAANIRAAGTQVDAVALELAVHAGKAKLQSATITRANNVLSVSAEAGLPGDIRQWQKMRWTAAAKATLPNAAQFLDKPPPVKGALSLEARAEGTGATPTKAAGQLSGASLAYETWRLPTLLTTFNIDGTEARVEIPPLELGTGNTLALKAALQMQDAMPVNAEWKLGITDPQALMNTTGLKSPPQPVTGTLESTGTAVFTVNDLGRQDYAKMLADFSLNIRDLQYGEGALQLLKLKAHVENGRAVLAPCVIQIDERNRIDLKGDAALAKPCDFSAEADIALPQLAALNPLLKTFGAPGIESGALTSSLDASGQLQPWRCRGRAALQAQDVRTAAMPEAASAIVETTFEGTRAELTKLEATLGPWKLGAHGVVDDRYVDLAELKVWQKDILLLDGHARAPFDVMQANVPSGKPADVHITAKDIRVSEVLSAAGIKDIPPGVLNADIAFTGRLDSASGSIKVQLRDVKVPGAPKSFQPTSLDLDTRLQDRLVQAVVKVLQPPLQPLTVAADLPFDAAAVVKNPQTLKDAPLKASVHLPETDLGFLREYAPDMITTLPARLKLDADIGGAVALPLVKAALDADVGEVGWSSADMPSVRDVRVRIRTNDRKAAIEDISAILAGGRVRLGGTVDATDPKLPAFDVKLEAREALVFRDPTSSLRANAAITCRGNLEAARVEGLVEAVRGRIFKEIDLLPKLGLPADVPAVPPNTQRSESRLTLPPMLKDWTFDVKVKTRDPVLISGNLVNGAVSADVQLGGSGAAPLLTGGANIDRMLLKLPFSMVKLTKGAITLNPARPFDPGLDIRGESRIGGNDITLYIYGDASNPKTRFTSTPPMSEPDIATLLATGTTLNGSASELASEAATRAAFLFISEMYRKAFTKKKVVREEPPRLNMTFNPSGADRGNDSVQASYELTDQWRVLGRFTQSGRMRAALGYLLRFGKAAQAVDEEVKP